MPRWNIMLVSVRICHLPCWVSSVGVGSRGGGGNTCKSKSKAHMATMWWDDEFYHTKAQIIWIKQAETAMRSRIVNSGSQSAGIVGPQPPCRYRGLINGINYISGTVWLQKIVQNLLFMLHFVANVFVIFRSL